MGFALAPLAWSDKGKSHAAYYSGRRQEAVRWAHSASWLTPYKVSSFLLLNKKSGDFKTLFLLLTVVLYVYCMFFHLNKSEKPIFITTRRSRCECFVFFLFECLGGQKTPTLPHMSLFWKQFPVCSGWWNVCPICPRAAAAPSDSYLIG